MRLAVSESDIVSQFRTQGAATIDTLPRLSAATACGMDRGGWALRGVRAVEPRRPRALDGDDLSPPA